jgi:hypothetical protein
MAINLSDPEVEFITRQFYDTPPTKDWSVSVSSALAPPPRKLMLMVPFMCRLARQGDPHLLAPAGQARLACGWLGLGLGGWGVWEWVGCGWRGGRVWVGEGAGEERQEGGVCDLCRRGRRVSPWSALEVSERR